MVRTIKPSDYHKISEIYNYYILNSIISFEETPVSNEEMTKRIKSIQSTFPFLVYEQDEQILGYAYGSAWNSRSAYKLTAESSVYLRQGESGKGVGSKLYAALIDRLIKMGIHTVIGGISLPNDGSVALHEKFGFEKAAHYKEVGFKFNKWIDVGYWQLMIK